MKRITTLIIMICILLTVAAQQQEKNTDINKVYVIFKTHLDVGFTELGNKVIDTYNQDFIPAALELSEYFAATDSLKNRYPWTTGSWLIWNYLQTSSQKNRQRMIDAIERGDFFWHAMPFTLQTELCDSSLLSAALAISGKLDQPFNRKTRAAKITDVPGVSRSIIPVFKRHGINLLHIGANPGAAVPQVPEVFRWKDTSGDEINVIYQSDYGKPLIIPGTKTAVLINFTHDNHGPHTRQQIEKIYSDIRKEYPNAQIKGASLNEVADEVLKVSSQLPLVTEEIGDTWMYGVGSEPRMIAELRQLMRLRNQWITNKKLIPHSELDMKFCNHLLLIAEHTWGLDVKTFLRNFDIYEFDKHRGFIDSSAFRYMEESWNEKRERILHAVAVLPAALKNEAMEELLKLSPEKPADGKFKIHTDYSKPIDTGLFLVAFDENTGAINLLKDKNTGKIWSDGTHPWGEFAYQNYSGKDFANFIKQYCPPQPEWWMLDDYGKPGLDKINVETAVVHYKPENMKFEKNKTGTTIWLAMKPTEGQVPYGAPREVYIKYFFPKSKKEISIDVNWFGKNKNRIPETAWFSFTPAIKNIGLLIDKAGSKIDVVKTVYNGARRIHGTTGKVYYQTQEQLLSLESKDAPLVVFNKPDLIDFNNEIVQPDKGIHFNLLNTMWGTNYPQWFGGDMKFRFTITL